MKGDKQKHEVNTFSLPLQVELARLGELIERVDERVDTHKAVLVEMPELSKRLDSNQLAANRIENGLLRLEAFEGRLNLLDKYIETALDMRPITSSDAPVVVGGAVLLPSVQRAVAPAEARANRVWIKVGLLIGAAVGSAASTCSVILWWFS